MIRKSIVFTSDLVSLEIGVPTGGPSFRWLVSVSLALRQRVLRGVCF